MNLKDYEERITELEEMYVMCRKDFIDNYDGMTPKDKAKILSQLRGLLDDIAKEAGGRAKRAIVETSYGGDSSFALLLAGVRGRLPNQEDTRGRLPQPEEPKITIDVAPENTNKAQT